MLLSVFTPSHNTRFLDECYQSLLAQTHRDWEWIVMLNGRATDWAPGEADERVKVIRGRFPPQVGMAKHAACELCTGEVLVELDHDDTLAPTCLEELAIAFEAHEEAAFVFTDFAQVN